MGFYHQALRSEAKDGNPVLKKSGVRTRKNSKHYTREKEGDVIKLS